MGEGRPSMARPRGVLLPPVVGFPPSLVGVGEEGRRREGEERGRPPFPSPIRIQGARHLPLACLLLSRMAQ